MNDATSDMGASDATRPDTPATDSGSPDAVGTDATHADTGVGDSGALDASLDADTGFCDPSATSLRLCVRFEDSFVDESLAPHTLRESGLRYADGRVGRAGEFDASVAAWIAQDGDLTGEPMTVELFLMPAELPSSGRVGVWDIGGQHSAWIRPGAEFACRSIAVSDVLTVGTWTHIACVFDGDASRVYVDGSPVATGVSSPGTAAAGDIRLGADNPDGDHFVGRIDELRIFRGARTAAEIAAAAAR